MKTKYICTLSALLICCSLWAQKKLQIALREGNTQLFYLSDLQRISFENKELNLHFIDLSNRRYELSTVQNLSFTEEGTSVNPQQMQEELTVFVVENYLKAKGLTEKIPVRIYSIDGRICTEGHLSDDTPVYLGNLNKGIYLLNVKGKQLKLYR